MEIRQTKRLEAGAAPIFFLAGAQDLPRHPFFKLLAEADRGLLQAFAAKADLKENAAHSVFLPSGMRALVLGKANPEKFNRRRALLAMRWAVAMARKEGFESIQVSVDDFKARGGGNVADLAELMIVQFKMANFEFTTYRTAPEEGWRMVHKVFVYSRDGKSLAARLARGLVIGQEVNGARALVNTPGGDMTPEKLAAEAQALGKKHGFKVQVLAEAEMKKLGMGGILGVGQGSAAGPRFIVLEYMNGSKKQKPLVFVGKGITFDSGGLNLKPEKSIYEMHMDMSGGAAVIHAIAALARLKARTNVVGLIPAAENMVSGSSFRPGDLLKTMSGKTIEVLNTDAEGRVVLSDALTYAERYQPRLVVDVATLTGAAMVALGHRASAVFTSDPKLEKALRELGEETGDYVWPLPLWEEYESEIKGTFGDVANLGKNDRYGGAITAAAFLWQFAKKYPWVHLDIAPRMTSSEGDHLAKGAMGTPVALLVQLATELR